eukprot:11894715-Alexandrium_andersonii.AAC.1
MCIRDSLDALCSEPPSSTRCDTTVPHRPRPTLAKRTGGNNSQNVAPTTIPSGTGSPASPRNCWKKAAAT